MREHRLGDAASRIVGLPCGGPHHDADEVTVTFATPASLT